MTGPLLDIARIYLEPAVEAHARGREILARFPEAERIPVASHWRIPELREADPGDFLRAKRDTLVLGVKKGLSFRPNGRSADFIAPSSSNGCAMACAYCYVARRKGHSNPISVFVNIEEIAASGPMTMAFGPLRPVGLEDPRTGVRPYAVVQLRQENREGTLFGLVGFQTRIKHPAQKAILRKLPGLARAEFVRLGQMHRNFYLDTPRVLTPNFRLPARPDVFFAGQITGVEGYVESIASGLWTALQVASGLAGRELPPLPPETVCGSLLSGFLFDSTSARFAPMNANFGLLPAVAGKHRGRKVRKEAKARRAYDAMTAWVGGLDDTLGGLRKD